MENLEIYNKAREVPEEAKKPIGGGKLKGMTDINAMWRIKKLTELFGACGIGWWTENVRFRTEQGARGEIALFCELNLVFVSEGKESKPIFGVGGSGLVNTEKSNLVTNDECFKMAYTDAISVACKALGIGADVYFERDRSKYDNTPQSEPQEPQAEQLKKYVCADCGEEIVGFDKYNAGQVAATTLKNYGVMLCTVCGAVRKQEQMEREANAG